MSSFAPGEKSPEVPGPFSAPVNAALTESFGQSLEGISVQHDHASAAAMNARAYTVGSSISLGAGIHDDIANPESMEIISHEVAHALAGGGSGEQLIDSGRRGNDPGEAAAYAASTSFRDFVSGGQGKPPPRLAPAHGGKAAVHRFEAGEHADAVDGAQRTLDAANAAGGNYRYRPEAAAASQRPMTLSNGVQVSAGEITAMMGDFYGAYTRGQDGREHFDPMASFNAMDNADPEEMRALIARIRQERESVQNSLETGAPFEHTENAELESLTNGRRLQTDENGTTTGYSLMDLAQKNSNHFNTQDESGTDNNMGAYAAFHAQAMQAAQHAAGLPPGPERERAEQRALALEASSQHFLTDRFSAGHQFDKAQMVEENGGGMIANLRARTIHNQLDENGAMLQDGEGNRWRALGDSHWADDANAENRARAAQTSLGSYGDITDILSGRRAADEMLADPAATAHQTAPVFDEAENRRLQEHAKGLSVPGMLGDNVGEIALLPTMAETWAKQNVVHPVVDGATAAWNWAGQRANDVADGASRAWDSAGRAWDGVSRWGRELIGQ